MPHGAIPFPFGHCRICSDRATGVHYGVATCEGCKGFYKRSLLKAEKYKCFFGGQCSLNPQSRNRCKYCRFQRCLNTGMSVDAVKMGRIPKVEKEQALDLERQKQETLRQQCRADYTAFIPPPPPMLNLPSAGPTDTGGKQKSPAQTSDDVHQLDVNKTNGVQPDTDTDIKHEESNLFARSRTGQDTIHHFYNNDNRDAAANVTTPLFIEPPAKFDFMGSASSHQVSPPISDKQHHGSPPYKSHDHHLSPPYKSHDHHVPPPSKSHDHHVSPPSRSHGQHVPPSSRSHDHHVPPPCRSHDDNPVALPPVGATFNSGEHDVLSRSSSNDSGMGAEPNTSQDVAVRQLLALQQVDSERIKSSAFSPGVIHELINQVLESGQGRELIGHVMESRRGQQLIGHVLKHLDTTANTVSNQPAYAHTQQASKNAPLHFNFGDASSAEGEHGHRLLTHDSNMAASDFSSNMGPMQHNNDIADFADDAHSEAAKSQTSWSGHIHPSRLVKHGHSPPASTMSTYVAHHAHSHGQHGQASSLGRALPYQHQLSVDAMQSEPYDLHTGSQHIEDTPLDPRDFDQYLQPASIKEEVIDPDDPCFTTSESSTRLSMPDSTECSNKPEVAAADSGQHGGGLQAADSGQHGGGLQVQHTLRILQEIGLQHMKHIQEHKTMMEEELAGRRAVHPLNQLKHAKKSQVQSVWDQLFQSIPATSGMILGTCSMLPGFRDLHQEDQQNLTKLAYFDVWMITHALFFNENESYLRLPSGATYSRWWMRHFLPKHLVDSMFRLANLLNDCHLSDLEIVVLCALQLTSPDREGTADKDSVRHLHSHYLDVLAHEVQQTHGSNHARILIDICRILPQMQPLSVEQGEIIGKFTVDTPPDGCYNYVDDDEEAAGGTSC